MERGLGWDPGGCGTVPVEPLRNWVHAMVSRPRSPLLQARGQELVAAGGVWGVLTCPPVGSGRLERELSCQEAPQGVQAAGC